MYTHYTGIYIYSVWVFMFMFVREGDRERERKRERKWEEGFVNIYKTDVEMFSEVSKRSRIYTFWRVLGKKNDYERL